MVRGQINQRVKHVNAMGRLVAVLGEQMAAVSVPSLRGLVGVALRPHDASVQVSVTSWGCAGDRISSSFVCELTNAVCASAHEGVRSIDSMQWRCLGEKEPVVLLPDCRPVPEWFRPQEEVISRDRSTALRSMGSDRTSYFC